MPSGRVEIAREGAALVVRIANEERANALDASVLDALTGALSSPEIAAARVVLLTGAGKRHFCAGIDLVSVPLDGLESELRAGERRLGVAAAAIEACPRPVVAVLNGDALGGGLELAMACDWRIARAGARLGIPAARLGVVYTPEGLRRFVAAMGAPRARRLFLTGRPLVAAEALTLGLVDELVPAPRLWPAALRAARDVAAGTEPAIAGTRALLQTLERGALDAGGQEEAARWRAQAFAVGGMRAALTALGEAPLGDWALLAVSAGLALHGAFSLIKAWRHKPVDPEGPAPEAG